MKNFKFKKILTLSVTAFAAISMTVTGVFADKEDNFIDSRDLRPGETVDVGNGAAAGIIKNGAAAEPTAEPAAESVPESTAQPAPKDAPPSTLKPTVQPAAKPTALPEYTTKMIKVVLTPSVPDIYYQNEKVIFDPEPFIDENNRTQVPIREMAEILGFNVKYDDTSQEILMQGSGRNVSLTVGGKTINVDDEEYEMDTSARIVNDRTYIPLRYITEAFGCGIIWE